MRRPAPIPLDAFEQAIADDPEVLGAFYFGSLGQGAATRFSDLDIFVWLADAVAMPLTDRLHGWLSLLGPVQWLPSGWNTGFVGPEWTQVDVEYAHRAELQPSHRYVGATIIKDRDGTLSRFLAACTAEQILETTESAAEVIRAAIGDQLFLARHNARGSIWSAKGNIAYQVTNTYELLGRLRGRRTYGYRYFEDLLTPDEQTLLAAAWPNAPTREENRRAARALWNWTKYVWDEAERILGQPLDIELDEGGLLAAVDHLYT